MFFPACIGFAEMPHKVSRSPVGNGRNTVSRVLFRRRELTEPHWVLGQTRWVLQKTRWVRSGTQIIGWEELTEFAPRNSVRPEKLTELSVTVLSEPYSARFQTWVHQNRASLFASDFYRRRGYRRELRSKDQFYAFSSQKKSRFASDFLRRGNRASWGPKIGQCQTPP